MKTVQQIMQETGAEANIRNFRYMQENYCLPALIHAGFTITSMAKRKSGLSKVA